MTDKRYEGIHEFLFVQGEEQASARIGAILRRWEPNKEQGPLFSAGLLAEGGDFRGFAHFGTDTAEELGELNVALWDEGIRSDYETEGKVYKDASQKAFGPRRHSPAFGALCRFGVDQRPDQVLTAIGNEFGPDIDYGPFVGGSQLLRRSRLLVQLGAADKDAVGSLVERLRVFDGVKPDDFRVGYIDPEATSA
jgi:hypothetical protein